MTYEFLALAIATFPLSALSLAARAGSSVALIRASSRLSTSTSMRETKKLATDATWSMGFPSAARRAKALM